ncbi:uncharacterized protein LOC107407357 [Ziziphus jujuba]|uniref:Uncharacterized protein LOC107407357 n=1 Tax=Ziziphus jujuba TaxID=326968 RepID=A0A6P3Z7G2_ZIZJJ|nr:uncharacterized protein LOC107407357 [Ziziphus jujuba]
MEIEIDRLSKFSSFRLRSRNSSIATTVTDSDIDDDHRYTSLKDIMMNSPTHGASNAEVLNEFSSPNISIRNQLVKHAASAYLQSTAILVSRNQNCFVAFWGNIENKGVFRSYWNFYIRNPLRACFRPILRFFASMVGTVRSRMIPL